MYPVEGAIGREGGDSDVSPRQDQVGDFEDDGHQGTGPCQVPGVVHSLKVRVSVMVRVGVRVSLMVSVRVKARAYMRSPE